MQHGRDMLNTLFPDIYNEEQSAELPAEEFLRISKGDNYGWPYCYQYDQFQGRKALAPEYGGDGKKQGRCEGTRPLRIPGHWAPMHYCSIPAINSRKNIRMGFHRVPWIMEPRTKAADCIILWYSCP